MNDLLASVVIVVGVVLAILSAVGVLRMGDLYLRLQVASKASSLGVGLLMLGVALHFTDAAVVVRALLVVAFIFLTTPVSAHLIARAASLEGTPRVAGTRPDEIAGAYDVTTGTLASRTPAADREPTPTSSRADTTGAGDR